jgi:ribonuclease BN (tRNA processing enzyme)
MRTNGVLITCLAASFCVARNAPAQTCEPKGLAVQILGSGGPRVNAERGSSSYLVRLDGRGRVLIDAGGGAFLRFGQAGGRLEELSLLALSHLHPDHSSDLPALLWLSNLARKEPLPIAGPSGSDTVPDFQRFLHRLFDD